MPTKTLKAEKDSVIAEDDSKKGWKIFKTTDKYIAEIDRLTASKEQEIMRSNFENILPLPKGFAKRLN